MALYLSPELVCPALYPQVSPLVTSGWFQNYGHISSLGEMEWVMKQVLGLGKGLLWMLALMEGAEKGWWLEAMD